MIGLGELVSERGGEENYIGIRSSQLTIHMPIRSVWGAVCLTLRAVFTMRWNLQHTFNSMFEDEDDQLIREFFEHITKSLRFVLRSFVRRSHSSTHTHTESPVNALSAERACSPRHHITLPRKTYSKCSAFRIWDVRCACAFALYCAKNCSFRFSSAENPKMKNKTCNNRQCMHTHTHTHYTRACTCSFACSGMKSFAKLDLAVRRTLIQ